MNMSSINAIIENRVANFSGVLPSIQSPPSNSSFFNTFPPTNINVNQPPIVTPESNNISDEPFSYYLITANRSTLKTLKKRAFAKYAFAQNNINDNLICQFSRDGQEEPCGEELPFLNKKSRLSDQARRCTKHLFDVHKYIVEPSTILLNLNKNSEIFKNTYTEPEYNAATQLFSQLAEKVPPTFSPCFADWVEVMVESELPATILDKPYFKKFVNKWVPSYDHSWTRKNYKELATEMGKKIRAKPVRTRTGKQTGRITKPTHESSSSPTDL